MQATGNSIITTLNSALEAGDMTAVESLWIQLMTNVKRSENMQLMLQKNIDKQQKYKQDNIILQDKLNQLTDEANNIKNASREVSSKIESEFTNCHESIEAVRRERDMIQKKYSENFVELSEKLDLAMQTRKQIDNEKETLIGQLNILLESITITDQTYNKQLQLYTGLDAKIEKLDLDMLLNKENHEMTKSDLEQRILLLTETEINLRNELQKYAIIFDNVFQKLSANKERSTEQQNEIDKLNGKVKELVKLRDQLIKKQTNLKKNIAIATDRLNELKGTITKTNNQISRYDGLIAAFEDQINELTMKLNDE